MKISTDEVLKDTIRSCLCIISKGTICKDDYKYFSSGIRRIAGHIYNENFNGEIAAQIACEVLYLVTCIYSNSEYENIVNYDKYINEKIQIKGARSINYLQKTNIQSYAYLFESLKLICNEINDIIY